MAVKDLVSGVLAESITTSTTNILVTIAQNIGASGIQAFFPTPPFYITIMPKSPIVGVANRLDSEIIQVTAVGHDQVGNAALTGVRAQRDTTAKPFSAGDIVTVGVYTDDAVLLGGTGTTETETPWIDTDDIVDGAVTTDKIDPAAVTNDKIDWSSLPKSQATNSSYVQIGNILIQYGQITGLTNISNTTINMPKSFANTNYTVVVTNQYAEAGQSYWWAFVCSKAVKSFVARAGFQPKAGGDGGANTNNICNWVAIGVAA